MSFESHEKPDQQEGVRLLLKLSELGDSEIQRLNDLPIPSLSREVARILGGRPRERSVGGVPPAAQTRCNECGMMAPEHTSWCRL